MFLGEGYALSKTLFSSGLVLGSLLWFAIQHLFLPSEIIRHILEASRGSAYVDLIGIKRDWCRVRSKKVAWREMLEPCRELGFLKKNPRYATDPAFSGVAIINIMPAGEHSMIRVDTYTQQGVQKSFGGDSIRVMFRGVETVSAAVFDLRNGSYEALALLRYPGEYEVHIWLDYTQCKGLKDPPTAWYVKAHCSGSKVEEFIPQNLLSDMRDYIGAAISPGLFIKVPPSRYNTSDLPRIVENLNCGFSCNGLWDGYGGWSSDGNIWNPSIPYERKGMAASASEQHSALWIYGDSISYYLFQRLLTSDVCKKAFKKCHNTYNWIYPKVLYEMRHTCSDVDVDIHKVVRHFREVLNNTVMDSRSVLMFNLGAHYIKNSSFRKYRDIIDALIDELRKGYRGKPVWKSSTALHKQNLNVMGAFRRYMTSQRAELFNAYANAAMCNANIDVLDVYPITASYPLGTTDGVHYRGNVSVPIESFISLYFDRNRL